MSARDRTSHILLIYSSREDGHRTAKPLSETWDTSRRGRHRQPAVSSSCPFDAGLGYTNRTKKGAAYAYRALDQLLVRYPDLPVVLFVDGVGCRYLWPGLANRTLGLAEPGALPHLGLANAKDRQIALVRVITNDGELFQPVRAGTLADLDDMANDLVPASTKLYRLPNTTSATY